MHVIATAGHVDHGKSTLIRALTGMEPDRWAEERRRGLTIDLGYAWTTLPDGTHVAFVDVPGHQRFITNMLAGIGPVPAVLLVVAADDGWGRQTSEHLAALDALGVRHGVLAVTRSDLADPAPAIAEARTYLAGTSLEHLDAVAVSPVTGTGLDELRAALARTAAALPLPSSPATRLWVDRVFTIRGAGTVVTGTLSSGQLTVGDELTVAGTARSVHVRGLQSLNRPITAAAAVARVAVNLRGVKPDQIRRGHALITAGLWAQTRTADARLVKPDGRLPAQAIVHIGSAAALARLRPLGTDAVRLRVDDPLPLHVGDRVILRDPGRQHVIAGAIILDTDPPVLTRRGAAARRGDELTALPARRDPGTEIRRLGAVRRDQLIAAGLLSPDGKTPAGTLAACGWLIADQKWDRWQQHLHRILDVWASEHPLFPGMPGSAAAFGLGLPDGALLDPLVQASTALTIDGAGVHRRETTATLPPLAAAALEQLRRRLAEHPFAAAERDQLTEVGLTDAHLATATRNGTLLRVAAGVYLLPDAVDEAMRRLALLPQPFTVSQARRTLDTTRRVALPLLELLDRRHYTRRVDTQQRSIAQR